MGIKKILKSVIIITAIVFLLIFMISNTRHTWKLFGYSFCENPNNINIHGIIKNFGLGAITLTCESKDNQKYFSGYVSYFDEENKYLYLGIKYNKYFGYVTKDSNVTLEIPCDINKVKRIYLTNGFEEIKIFPVGVQ